MRTAWRSLLIGALLAATPAASGAQGVHVAVMPFEQNVAPGATFDVELDVTQAGDPFNGFDAIVSYDPAALQFIALSPTTLQQGCLMTGACSAACGNTFHRFSAAGDSLSITDILLCNQIALTGPGQVYKLRFKASNTAQVTWVRIRRAVFYNAGVYVTPVATADAAIGIGVTLGVDDGPGATGLRLRAEPNPSAGVVRLTAQSAAAGVHELQVFDTAGRLVRRIASGWQPAGSRAVTWDGTSGSGVRCPAGIYLVTLRVGERRTRTRVTLLE